MHSLMTSRLWEKWRDEMEAKKEATNQSLTVQQPSLTKCKLLNYSKNFDHNQSTNFYSSQSYFKYLGL